MELDILLRALVSVVAGTRLKRGCLVVTARQMCFKRFSSCLMRGILEERDEKQGRKLSAKIDVNGEHIPCECGGERSAG